MKNYIIVTGRGISELEDKVGDLLDNGYGLIGSPFVLRHANEPFYSLELAQALYKYKFDL